MKFPDLKKIIVRSTFLLIFSLAISGCSSLDKAGNGLIAPALNEIGTAEKLDTLWRARENVHVKSSTCDSGEKSYEDFQELVDRHTLVAGDRGNMQDVEKADLFPNPDIPFPDQFQKIMRNYETVVKREGYKDILIYLNGGLNTLSSVRKQAASQIPCMLRDGYYPIFLIWQTGPLATYREQVVEIRNGRHNGTNWATGALYVAGDVGEGIARSPVTLWNSFMRFWQSKMVVSPEYEVTLDRVYAKNSDTYRYYKNVSISDSDEHDQVTGWEAEDFLYPLTFPSRVITTPFLDSMGTTAWENMTRRSRTPVRSVVELQTTSTGIDDGSVNHRMFTCYPGGVGVFSRFFKSLQVYLEGGTPVDPNLPYDECGRYLGGKDIEKDSIKITLIGHSMGTMALNELLSTYRTLPYEHIVYMAAASSIRDFMDAVPRVIETADPDIADVKSFNDCKVKFYSLMLDPIAEAREVTAKGAVISGSLLEWIDTIYENPETPLDRTLGMWRNIRPVLHTLEGNHRTCMSFNVFNYGTHRILPGQHDMPPEFCDEDRWVIADPRKHGQFNDTDRCYWQPRFWKPEVSDS